MQGLGTYKMKSNKAVDKTAKLIGRQRMITTTGSGKPLLVSYTISKNGKTPITAVNNRSLNWVSFLFSIQDWRVYLMPSNTQQPSGKNVEKLKPETTV